MSALPHSELLVAASCVLVGRMAVLIRGPSGSGKSTLALALLRDPRPFRFARLVADDQVRLSAASGRIVAAAPPAIAGRIEQRGLGLHMLAHEALARVALVADLVEPDAVQRLPEPDALRTQIAEVTLPRLPVPARQALAAPLVCAAMAALAAGRPLSAFGEA